MSGNSMSTAVVCDDSAMPRRCRIFLALYLLAFIALSIGAKLHPDAYYYWQWSHQLALSYYDGPPMIAYVLKILTTLFGNNPFAVRLLGIMTAAVSAWLLFHLGRRLFDRRAGEAALYIWLLTLGVIRFFFLENSYNDLLTIFWGLLFHAFIQLTERRRCRDYYLLALVAVLMLWTKYTSLLLLLSLLVVVLSCRDYRSLFRSKHAWLALLLIIVLCLPLLVWQMSHHWVSINFLLHRGFIASHHTILSQRVAFYLLATLVNYQFSLLLLLFFLIRYHVALWYQLKLRLLALPLGLIWLFFFVSSFFALPMMNWNSPCALPGAVLLGYFITRSEVLSWLRMGFYIVIGGIAIIYAVGCRYPRFYIFSDPVWVSSVAITELLHQLPFAQYKDEPIFTSFFYMLPSWIAAEMPERRQQVFALNETGHQYYLWWQQAQKRHDYRGQQVLYVSQQPLSQYKKPFYPSVLRDCHLLKMVERYQPHFLYGGLNWQLYLYRCTFF